MSASDAEILGVATGSKVMLSTRQGQGEAMVEVNDRMMPGHMSHVHSQWWWFNQ